MSDQDLARLAERAGLEVQWRDSAGVMQSVAPPTLRAVLAALGLPAESEEECHASGAALSDENACGGCRLLVTSAGEEVRLGGGGARWQVVTEQGDRFEGDVAEGVCLGTRTLPMGYHEMEVGGRLQQIAIVPQRAYAADEASGRRLAGLAVQLYGLRRAGGGGAGDFLALERLVRGAAAHGMDALLLSPIHALSSATPERFAPYFPSSRIAINPVYAVCAEEAPARLRDQELVDWPGATAQKLACQKRAFATERGNPSFGEFCRTADPRLRRYALFETLAADAVAHGGRTDWRGWPAELRDPAGPRVRRFAREHAGEIAFHLYLQQRASTGLAAAAAVTRACGMAIGLIADLAVGVDPGGADAWAGQDEMLAGVSIGAPPDFFNRKGQGWGLTGFSPFGLRRSGFAGFLAMLRTVFRSAGGVRIDHAMGLERLWLIPEGASAREGVYVHYPSAALMGLLALESRRHRSIVLGEDLGVVPAGFSERLAHRGVAGLSVLWLERDARGFRPPSEWRAETVAMTATHDMPTVAGWWRGCDIAWRKKLHLVASSEAERARERSMLWRAFSAAGCATGAEPGAGDSGRVATAAATYLGRSAAKLALLPLEDALALSAQPNIPGTIAEHPNWRRRMPEPVETMLDRPEVAERLAAFVAARGQP